MKNLRQKKNTIHKEFIAPDGGWGWIVIVACGISNLCVLPILQNFGFIFLERFTQLGLSSFEITTIINVNMAMTSVFGLLNGPMFRKYSFRQVSFFGGLVCTMAIIALSKASTFFEIFISMSIIYAAGMGVTLSANALALNTYFDKKKRIAIGLSWTCTGIGPIIIPQIVNLLTPKFGVSGTVLILGAVTLNSIASALLLQPVSWHARKIKPSSTSQTITNKEDDNLLMQKKTSNNYAVLNCSSLNHKLEIFPSFSSVQGFDSQCCNDSGREITVGADVIIPEIPMTLCSNERRENNNLQRNISCNEVGNPSLLTPRKLSKTLMLVHVDEIEGEEDQKLMTVNVENNNDRQDIIKKQKSPLKRWVHEIVIFFDLMVLKDYVFVTLMLGMNFAIFVEMNFSILTPFILSEYGFSKQQIAKVLSILAGTDVIVRLLISFVASKIGWQNRTFFLLGIACLAVGRTVIAHVSSYEVIIATSVLLGFGKGLRTVFMALVIPSHVSLSKLPAASGLQLASSGIIYPLLGPLVGLIHDKCGNYTILLHILNLITYAIILAWTVESWITSKKNKEKSLKFNKNDIRL